MNGKKQVVQDTLNGNEGKGYITINGKTRELFELLNLEAKIEMIVSERKVMGNRFTQYKVAGAKGSGNIKMYFNNADLLKEIQNYIKTGFYPQISIQAYIDDATSSVGRQEVVLRDVVINEVLAIKLDAETEDGLTHESDFNFGDIDGLEYFK